MRDDIDGEAWFIPMEAMKIYQGPFYWTKRFDPNNFGKEVNEMPNAKKCSDCEAYADEMPGQEEFIFRYRNGDRKMVLVVQFMHPSWKHTGRVVELCNKCKAAYIKKALERMKNGGE